MTLAGIAATTSTAYAAHSSKHAAKHHVKRTAKHHVKRKAKPKKHAKAKKTTNARTVATAGHTTATHSPVETTAPQLSGTTVEGSKLAVTNGTWSYSPTSYTHAWLRCGSSGGSCATIAGATSNSYTLASSDVGHAIEARVTAVNSRGSASATTAPSATVTAPVAASGSSLLIGTQTVEPTADSNGPNSAQAFSFTSSSAGTANSIDVYVDTPNTATGLIAGLYADNSGNPGALLATGSLSSIKNGAWNAISIPATAVSSSTTYWLAVLGTGGTIAFRDNSAASSCATETSWSSSLNALPSTWAVGLRWTSYCPISAYVSGSTATGTGAGGTSAGTGTIGTGSGGTGSGGTGSGGTGSGGTGSGGTGSGGTGSGGTGSGGTGSGGTGSGGTGSGGTGSGGTGSGGTTSPTVNVFVAQNAAGTGDGSSCANAQSASWFNSSSNWGTGGTQIGPGTVVGLCGTITSQLTVQGSGTSANPITIYWEPGATLSEPYCPGRDTACLNTNNNSYLTLNGGSNGSILSTANGTGLANQNGNVVGLWAEGCNGCTIENLNISDMYVHTSATDTAADTDDGMFVSGSDLTIADNTLHDDDAAINGVWDTTDQNIAIFGNDIYNINGAFNSVVNNESGGSIGPILFYDNTVGNYGNWDTTDDAYHHDGIHCWTSDGGAGAHYNGFYIYDNQFGGTTDLAGSPYGDEMTAQIFLEGSPDGTPCSDNSSNFYIFNNVLTENAFINNGLIGVAAGTDHIYNNTMIGADTTQGVCLNVNNAPSGQIVENDVLTGCGTQVYDASSATFATLDHNVEADNGGWVFGSNYLGSGASQFAQWQSLSGGDAHSVIPVSASLNSDGSLQTGSPASGEGTNLSSMCTGDLAPLCTTIGGTQRPSTGSWNAGAY